MSTGLGESLSKVSKTLVQFLSEFDAATHGEVPFEATMTDILTKELSNIKGFIVSVERTAMRTEAKVGHDVTVKVFDETEKEWTRGQEGSQPKLLWVCFLQAKMMKGGLVDFTYPHDKVYNHMNTSGILIEEQRLKELIEMVNGEIEKELQKKKRAQELVRVLSNQLDRLEEIGRAKRMVKTCERNVSWNRRRIIDKNKQLQGCENSRKIQAELLGGTLNAEISKNPRRHSARKFTAGYVVYDTKGIYFLPIDKVLEEIRKVLPKPGKANPGQAKLNELATTALLPRNKARPGLKAMLPEGL